MSLYFTFGDFQAEGGSVSPLLFTPTLTCQGIYDYVTNLFDQTIYIAFQHGGGLILIDPTWNISECFPNMGNQQLIIYLNPIPPTQNPPFKILGISIIIKINENIVNQINAQATQTLNDIYNSLEIPEGQQIVGVQFFDGNGTEIPQNGAPLSQYPFPQPFTLNLITQISKIVIDVYINNNYTYQMQVQSNTMLLELVQQIQTPQNKIIRGYGLYDSTCKLLVNTDALLKEFQHQTQPLFLNIETQDFQQQPVVCLDIYVNGEKSVLSTFETDKTLQDIINSTQISNGEMIAEFALWDASRQSIEANIQTPLQQFVACTQPLQLHIRTILDQLHRLQSVVCLRIQIDDQREINQNVIGSKTLFEVKMQEYQILNELTIPQGLVIAQFFLLDASGQQLSSDSSLEIQKFANCTQPLQIQIKTALKSFNLNVYLNNQPYVQVIAYYSNKLSEIISQIQIPPDQFIQSYTLLDVQQNVIANSDVVFSTLMDRIDPFSLFMTVVQQQVAKKSKIRIVEVINTPRLSEETNQTQQQPYYTQVNYNQQNNNQQFGYQGLSNQQQQRPYSEQQRPPQINSQQLVQPQNNNQYQKQQQQFSPPQDQQIRNNIVNIPQPQVSTNYSSPQAYQQRDINAVQPGIGIQAGETRKQINIQEVQQPVGIGLLAISPDQTKKQIHIQEVQQAAGIGIQAITPAETRKKALESLQILKKITLIIDDRGEYVVYQFHKPIQIKGLLLKEESSPKPEFNKSVHKWVQVKKIQYAQTGDYSFAIMWDNGNISKVKINVL